MNELYFSAPASQETEQANVSHPPLREKGETLIAEFAVDSAARLGIAKGGTRINLEPAEVVSMIDFLTAITYKTLAQRAGAEGGAT